MPAVAFIVASATGANPHGSGSGATTVVTDSGEPSLTLPLLVFSAMLLALVCAVVWWRRLGGWSPAEMTITLQLTGRDIDALGAEIDSVGRPWSAMQAHQRAAEALANVLRRRELGVVHELVAEARRQLAASVHSQQLPVQPTSDPVAEFLP